MPNSADSQMSDEQAIQRLQLAKRNVLAELSKVIVGQTAVMDEILVGLFSQGHCLLVGVPGLAKTLMVRTLASTLSLDFRRIQFTPDLMPSDITGTELIQQSSDGLHRELKFVPGPVFGNIILADEINRTPPKTQAAMLEAMQEKQVTVSGLRHPLPSPFFVLATQNPIEQEGTYPLPEAQLDRFMLNILVDYPSEDEELAIVQRTTSDHSDSVAATLDADEIAMLCQVVRRVPVADPIARYAVRIARQTRPDQPAASEFVQQYVMWGAGPRASQYLVLGAKARAALDGRLFVCEDDIRALAPSVLRHRLRTNYNADSEGITADDIIQNVINSTSLVAGGSRSETIAKAFRSANTD